jgi:hypothetical protein
MHIAKITSRGEEYFERYGGDDIHEPPPKGFFVEGPSPILQSETTVDANMITWDSLNDPLNPQNWSTKYKWFVTFVCTVITVNVTFASSAPSSATIGIMKELNVSREVSNLITTVFLLGYVFGVNLSQLFPKVLSNHLSSLSFGVQEANLLDANQYSSCRWSFILYFTLDKLSHLTYKHSW